MRSTAFTFGLLLCTLVTCGLAGWRLSKGSLAALLGTPPTPPGQRLYTSFTPDEVRKIQISAAGTDGEFVKGASGWQVLLPWQDRMDPRAAVGIISFTLGMRVEDLAPVDEIPLQETGLTKDAVHIRLEGADGRPLAKYRLGRRTPWQGTDPETGESIPTLFVQPWDKNRKSHVFTCTGDILPLFKNHLKFLRDHHPFYFHPATLGKIRIRSPEGELTLGRESPNEAWHIVKPLNLRTDPAAMKALIEGLHNLRAVAINDSAVAPPTTGTGVGAKQIALTLFGSDTETVLEVYPAEGPAARDGRATVSDRPGTVFNLPLKPERELVSLADLPLAVNDLRDPTLTNLNIASLEAVSIQPSTGPEIFITRQNPKLWTTLIDGRQRQANEIRLFELLKAVSTERAIGFESDAATDFTPWGLTRPFLKLSFIGQDSQTITLRFGMDKRGNIFVNRLGTSSVMRIDKSLLSSIAIHPYEWRHSRLWSLSRVDLVRIERTTPPTPTLTLRYDFIKETWGGEVAGKDVSDELNPATANFLLGALESLEITRWLAASDADAISALSKPVLTLMVEERTVDDLGDTSGVEKRELKFAPVPGTSPPQLYYGRLTSDTQPFLLDRAIFEKLAVNLRADQ
ncbi:MAG: DUF4340 domain-containing protein [Verrucomicrobia bacterium]|nr:DUF4340 domain-containing protein [Verrucomicrobiota bacterium]